MRKLKVKVYVFEVVYVDGFKEKIVTKQLDSLGCMICTCWGDIKGIKEIKKVGQG